jgi:hypothetical protein
MGLSRMNKSRRAQLLLSCAKSSKQYEPEVNEFIEIFKDEGILVVTLETLNKRLNYLESSLIEWYIKKGLPEQYAKKSNIIVMSSEDDIKRQEIFEFDVYNIGYCMNFNLTLTIQGISRVSKCRVKVHKLRLDLPNGISAFQTDNS